MTATLPALSVPGTGDASGACASRWPKNPRRRHEGVCGYAVKRPGQDPRWRQQATERLDQVLALPMLVLTVMFLAVLVLPVIYPDLLAGSRSALEAIDMGIWTVFLAEYLARLFVAPDRLAFVRRSGEPRDYVRPGTNPRDHRRPQRDLLLYMDQGTVDVAPSTAAVRTTPRAPSPPAWSPTGPPPACTCSTSTPRSRSTTSTDGRCAWRPPSTRPWTSAWAKRLTNLPALREIGYTANRRLLAVQRLSRDPITGDSVLRSACDPVIHDGTRVGGLRLTDPRPGAADILLIFRLHPAGS